MAVCRSPSRRGATTVGVAVLIEPHLESSSTGRGWFGRLTAARGVNGRTPPDSVAYLETERSDTLEVRQLDPWPQGGFETWRDDFAWEPSEGVTEC